MVPTDMAHHRMAFGTIDQYLISGASGFIGERLLTALLQLDRNAVGLFRQISSKKHAKLGTLFDVETLKAACLGSSCVFHCAGHVHAFASLSNEEARYHWQINFEGTRNLVKAAGQVGVQRFIFLSSVKAMATPGEECANEDFSGQPDTAYGHSKRAAEEAVLEAGVSYGMHVVNLRLAMVYGKGGRGNLARMGRLIQRGWFPPLPETGNHRSLVHVDDVVDAMLRVAEDDRANGRTYIIASPQAPSGRALYDAVRTALGLPSCAWAVPASVWRLAGRYGDGLERILRRRLPLDSETVSRLLDSAWYSPARIEQELGWRARIELHTGLQEMFGR